MNFEKKIISLTKFTKLKDIYLEANNINNFKNKINERDDEDIIETFSDELNLSHQLLLNNDRNIDIRNTNLIETESFPVFKLDDFKEKDKGINKNELSLNIEMKLINNEDQNKSLSIQSDSIGEEKIENIDNLSEEIIIKEPKGPILFKIDNYQIELIQIWKRIKLIIITLCFLAGFIFYISIPLIISYSDIEIN